MARHPLEELPFSFVDHALRHGDSLVGLDLDQIRGFHWKPDAQLEFCSRALDDALEQALEHRAQILELAENEDAASQREKQRLLEYAEQATARIRMIADACVGAFFAEAKPKAREKERNRRLEVLQRALEGDEAAWQTLAELAAPIRDQHAPFHWMIEFPEVFYLERPDPLEAGGENRAAFMEAFVGNPPFAGVTRVAATSGPAYVGWLQETVPGDRGMRGRCDLSAYFFRRADDLLGPNGTIGFIATNTIGQGDTRKIGLQFLLTEAGGDIYDATSSMMWPGAAAVTVSIVNIALGSAIACTVHRRLDGVEVPAINSRLRGKPERPDAVRLSANDGCSFQGVIVLGTGFVLGPSERRSLIRSDPRNAGRIFPYINGQELNTSPTQTHDRFILNFGHMELAEAEGWPELLAIIRSRVKPERDRLHERNAWNRDVRRRWWQFASARPEAAAATADIDRCLVAAILSPLRVSVEVDEGPWKLVDDHVDELVALVAEGGLLPARAVAGHVEPPEVDGVAPKAEVLVGGVFGAGFDDDRCAVLAST